MNNYEKIKEAEMLINEVIKDECGCGAGFDLVSETVRILGDNTPKITLRLDIIEIKTKCIG